MKHGSSIRSAERATFSAPSRWPIRWRLASGSALLTFVILCFFAAAVGTLTTDRVREDFDREVRDAGVNLAADSSLVVDRLTPFSAPVYRSMGVNLESYAKSPRAHIRVGFRGRVVQQTEGAPNVGDTPIDSLIERDGYVITTFGLVYADLGGGYDQVKVQYIRPLTQIRATINRVRVFLLGGVLSGTALALLAGVALARRAMRPVADLTKTARRIEETRDPALRMPIPVAHDEVAELAETLESMLEALNASRTETIAALRRQREFVADASHELRTPLTSVLANLELLVETLDGERRDAAASALRSSQRMRRLVADLLLLARADAARSAPHEPTDLARVVVEAAAELGPVAVEHELVLDAHPAFVDGARDELHRLALNLMQNAITHTAPGTHVRAVVETVDGHVKLTVEDDGPGIAPELKHKVFERFVRGGGDRDGKSSGLGLAIVRAVARSHDGDVTVVSPTMSGPGPADSVRGTRFVVTLPSAATR